MGGLLRGRLFSQAERAAEEIMFVYSTDAMRAEMTYRQERIRRDFQRPSWFQRKRVAQPPQPCAPELRARPAM